jgi:flagellar biosynthesis anti-sigma factor FlgM
VRIDPNVTRVGAGGGTDRVGGRRVEGENGAAQASRPAAAQADAAVLSPQAQDVRTAMKALAREPEVREGLVAEVQQQISDGTFTVDAGAVADKIAAGGP